MTEVHTTEVTLAMVQGQPRELVELLKFRGFLGEEGSLAGEVTFETRRTGLVQVTQTLEEGYSQGILKKAEEEFRKEVEVDRVADYQGKQVGLGSNTEEVEKLKAGKGLVGQVQAQLWAGGNKDVFREAGWEIGEEPKIEFQKIWRIEDTEVVPQDMGVLMEVLISKGARHTGRELDGIIGYGFQDGWVAVVQTVLEEG